MEIEMSALDKTWVLDLDGTLVKHNGYKIDGEDSLLDGIDILLSQIEENDLVIIVTSRKLEHKEMTEKFLDDHKIRYDYIIYEAPYGERILVNDRKPSGLDTAYAINSERDLVTRNRIKRNSKL